MGESKKPTIAVQKEFGLPFNSENTTGKIHSDEWDESPETIFNDLVKSGAILYSGDSIPSFELPPATSGSRFPTEGIEESSRNLRMSAKISNGDDRKSSKSVSKSSPQTVISSEEYLRTPLGTEGLW